MHDAKFIIERFFDKVLEEIEEKKGPESSISKGKINKLNIETI